MKVEIWKDERWPDYGICENEKYADQEVPDELVARWKIVSKDYDQIQDELAKLYDKARS